MVLRENSELEGMVQETVFMAVCDNVVRAKGMSAFPQMPSLQVLQLGIEDELWTIMQHTRSQMRRDNSFYSQPHWALLGKEEAKAFNKLVTVWGLENLLLTRARKQNRYCYDSLVNRIDLFSELTTSVIK